MLSLLGASLVLCPHLRPPAIKSIPYRASEWTAMHCRSRISKTKRTMCLSSPFHKYGKKELKCARRDVRPITGMRENPWVWVYAGSKYLIPIEAQLLFQGLVILIEI